MEPLAPEDLVEEWSDLSTSSLGPGAQLGRYQLLLPIAYGGMARVWAARQMGQRGFTKLVAIKTILPHLAHAPEFERMFLDEARIAAGVHHPNVTEIYELGEEGHVLYLAMEWVNGESLVHVIRGLAGKTAQPLDPRIAARIVADACAGLHAAHELTDDDGRLLGVVHRDVSPHNILVSLDGTVKVTDFGVAKALGQSHQATTAGQIKGKVAYMAPEIIGGGAFDRRSDVFAMGCVLYEATTGALPFRGGNDPQVMQAVLKGTYEPPPVVVRGFPLELASVIDCALAPDPRKRFATAERMRVALEEWLARSGPLVTATQVGALVRQRLGPHLEKRREHVRTAMASAQEQDAQWTGAARQATGLTPSTGGLLPKPSPVGQSHSGVVPTAPEAARTRMPSHPAAPQHPPPAPQYPPSVEIAPQPPPVAAPPEPPPPSRAQVATLPIVPKAAPAASGMRYLVAAVAGIGFALLVGGTGVIVWVKTHAPPPEIGVAPLAPPTAAVTAPARATPAPPPTVATTPPPPATAAAPPASVAVQPPAASAPSAAAQPATIDINDLPTAKPAWMTAPPGPARPGAPPGKPPEIPANPY